uniref:Glutathione synthetase n=1 Tax=Lygus hesperus TaxID=30085 RepID=A0A0A9ZGS9_LYGHE
MTLASLTQYLQPIVLVVTQEGEVNTADQYKLLLQLTEAHKVISLRRTFAEIHDKLRMYTAKYNDDEDENNCLAPPFGVLEDRYLVSVVYFRNSYVPSDFPTETH